MTSKIPFKWAFFGTDDFAVAVLEGLLSDQIVPSLVVTTPDKPKGRKLIITPSPVKRWAEKNQIPCVAPANLKTALEFERETWDLFLVASYGKIIPARLLKIPKHGILNIHPSLLPRHRGPSPLETTILEGDLETGVTIMLIDEEVDHGPIIASDKLDIENWKPNYQELRETLAKLGAELFERIVPDWIANKIKAREQDHRQATFTRKFTKEDGLINLSDNPVINDRKIRAFSDWPGTYFFIEKDNRLIRVSVKKAHLSQGELVIDRVVPAGRKEMNWEDFKRNP